MAADITHRHKMSPSTRETWRGFCNGNKNVRLTTARKNANYGDGFTIISLQRDPAAVTGSVHNER